KISAMTRDISEVIEAEFGRIEPILAKKARVRMAFHPPCTLQHGQNIKGLTERVLARAGFELTPVPDSHLCCGSAGTYSLLQPDLSEKLRRNKLTALRSGGPELIATANIGCQVHLAAIAGLTVQPGVVAVVGRREGGGRGANGVDAGGGGGRAHVVDRCHEQIATVTAVDII